MLEMLEHNGVLLSQWSNKKTLNSHIAVEERENGEKQEESQSSKVESESE